MKALHPGQRVWHANLPDWPGTIEPSPTGRWHVACHVPYVRVRWDRQTERLANPGWIRQDVLLTEPRP